MPPPTIATSRPTPMAFFVVDSECHWNDKISRLWIKWRWSCTSSSSGLANHLIPFLLICITLLFYSTLVEIKQLWKLNPNKLIWCFLRLSFRSPHIFVLYQWYVYCIKHLICYIHDDVIKWKHFRRYWPQRPVNRSFDVFFDLCLNKRLSKQSWGWWFETLPRPLWHQCNVYVDRYHL